MPEHHAVGDAMPQGVAARHSQRFGRDVGRDDGRRRPLVLAPARIEVVLERTCRSDALQREVKSLWDRLVDRFVELPFVRTRRAWNPVDLVDGLLDLLKFSRGAASSRADPGRAAPIEGRNLRATDSKRSPTRHTRSSSGLTLENTRRMRSPRLGRDGNASTCSRESSLRQDMARPTAGCGRKLVRARRTKGA